MKLRLLPLLLLLLVAPACRSQSPSTATPSPAPSPTDPMDLPWEDRSIFSAGLVGPARSVLDEMPSATVYHLQYEINADLIHLQGQEQVHYTNTESQALDDVRLRLFPNILGGDMQIPQVKVDDQPITPSYSLEDSLLIVPLASPLKPGESVMLGLDFSVTIPDTVEYNYGVLAYAEGVLALAHAYPMIPVYNEEGWNAEVPPHYGDVTFADMSFFIVRVTAPKNLTLVAVGRELDRKESGETQTVTYAAGPVRDFYLAASPDYEMVTERAGDTSINFYAPASLRAGAQDGLAFAVRAVEDFSQRYAAFPYTELDLVGTPTRASGIEYPGMIAITNGLIVPGNQSLEGTVAHEVAHQWFYNLVGSDQLDQPWLDESLAQFVTLQYFTDKYGQSGATGFKQYLEQRWQRAGGDLIPIGLPVAAYSDQQYGAIIYGRGGLFFEALHQQMDTDAFDSFMKDYTSTYSWGIATPEDLKGLAEKHCSCDLTAMFQEWVYP